MKMSKKETEDAIEKEIKTENNTENNIDVEKKNCIFEKEINKDNNLNELNKKTNQDKYEDYIDNEKTNQKNNKNNLGQENKIQKEDNSKDIIIEELNKKIKDLTDTLKRLQADFINYKNRAEKEKIYYIEYGNADLIKKILPVLDSFDLALQHTTDFEKFKKGIEMVYAQLYDILEHEGLKKIDCNGKFDPYKHEVLMKVDSDKEEDEIIQELQKGYMLKDKVIRNSKVKISSGKFI